MTAREPGRMPCPQCGTIGELCRESALSIEATRARADVGEPLTLWELAGLRSRKEIREARP